MVVLPLSTLFIAHPGLCKMILFINKFTFAASSLKPVLIKVVREAAKTFQTKNECATVQPMMITETVA